MNHHNISRKLNNGHDNTMFVDMKKGIRKKKRVETEDKYEMYLEGY